MSKDRQKKKEKSSAVPQKGRSENTFRKNTHIEWVKIRVTLEQLKIKQNC